MSVSGLTIKDFAADSFSIEKYVEKLAQLDSNTGLGPMSKCEVKPFNSQVLLESFEGSMRTLQELAEKNQRRVNKLDHVCLKQEKEHANRVGELEGLYSDAFSEFQVLEERIIAVSTKVVHLGDQLESSNCRRMRAMEAQNLMEHLKEFDKPRPTLPIFTDPVRRIEAGDLIFKLQMLSSELPQGEKNKYMEVKEKIARKYVEIEAQLVDAFIDAHHSLDTKRMRQYAQALAPFPLGCQKAMDNYIHFNIPQQQFNSIDEMLFAVEKTCRKAHDQIVEVFDSPDAVMTKFIQAILDKVLQKRIDSELKNLKKVNSDNEKYLTILHHLYGKVMKLQEKLAKYIVSVDPQFLSRMTRINLFGKYLLTYTEVEIQHLVIRSSYILSEFQDMVGISRKGAPGRLNLGRPTLSANRLPEETYISQDVCTGIIHEAKCSIKRAKALLSDRELSDIAKQIYLTVLDKLCVEHFHLALDLTQTIDLKSAPVGYFCTIVGHININMHLLEDLFREVIMLCIMYPSMASTCVARKREVASKLEAKIETGIEKTLTHMVSSVKQLLSTHQKKSDFKPETPSVIEGTQACNYVVSYVGKCCQVLHDSLDGKNLEVVLLEFGISLHRVIFENLQQFSINDIGAMVIICDMNEYRRVMKAFKNSLVDEFFEGLQTLCNLFVVKAENLPQVCSEEPYANFDRSVLQVMIQLRSDSKTKGTRIFRK